MSEIPPPFIGGTDRGDRTNPPSGEWPTPYHSRQPGRPANDPMPIQETADTLSEPSAPDSEPSAEEGQKDYPDFIFGDDSASEASISGSEPPASTQEAAEPAPSTPAPVAGHEQVVQTAHALHEGEFGAWIDALIDDLQGYSLLDAVPRAFAAGYLAARSESGS